MNFDDVIKARKTIRKYKNKEVSEQAIHSILESALLAPSAKNRQPWRFYVLDHQQKDDIVTMMYEWDKNNKDFGSSIKGSANQKKPDYLSLGAAI